mgnify:FL=1
MPRERLGVVIIQDEAIEELSKLEGEWLLNAFVYESALSAIPILVFRLIFTLLICFINRL